MPDIWCENSLTNKHLNYHQFVLLSITLKMNKAVMKFVYMYIKEKIAAIEIQF